MSWKIYGLGTAPNQNVVSREVVYKLQELGYDATNTTGSFIVAIDGNQYTATVAIQSGERPYYLCVNDETNDIVVTTLNTSATSTGCNFSYLVAAAILSGKNIQNGENGMFVIANTAVNSSSFSNASVPSPGNGYLVLQRAYFVPYSSYNANTFVSTLYWGSSPLTPGIVVEVGTDRFVCLSAFLYAKL